MRFVLLGAPGSGKGTQAQLLAEDIGVPSISTGEMLREAVAARTPLGVKVDSIMASGQLVDDETIAAVVRERLSQADVRRGFILDGYPRTAGQAEALAEILTENGWELDAVIYLEVPESELVVRALARQRADDREEVIRQRIQVYREQTEPLIAYYDARDLLRPVDGHRSIEQVARALRQALEVAR